MVKQLYDPNDETTISGSGCQVGALMLPKKQSSRDLKKGGVFHAKGTCGEKTEREVGRRG